MSKLRCLTEDEQKEIADKYLLGSTITNLAKEYNRSKDTVRKAILLFGGKIRTPQETTYKDQLIDYYKKHTAEKNSMSFFQTYSQAAETIGCSPLYAKLILGDYYKSLKQKDVDYLTIKDIEVFKNNTHIGDKFLIRKDIETSWTGKKTTAMVEATVTGIYPYVAQTDQGTFSWKTLIFAKRGA